MGELTDVVIPCRDDWDTIGRIIIAFQRHSKIGNIIVAGNGPRQDSWDCLFPAQVLALDLGDVGGKGQAVKRGLDYVETQRVIFCDADLTGLTSHHIDFLARPYYGQLLGIPDRPERMPVPWPVPHQAWAWMTGMRTVPTWIARSLELHGYAMEAQINQAIAQAGLPTLWERMRGVTGKIRQNERRMAELRRDRKWWAANQGTNRLQMQTGYNTTQIDVTSTPGEIAQDGDTEESAPE